MTYIIIVWCPVVNKLLFCMFCPFLVICRNEGTLARSGSPLSSLNQRSNEAALFLNNPCFQKFFLISMGSSSSGPLCLSELVFPASPAQKGGVGMKPALQDQPFAFPGKWPSLPCCHLTFLSAGPWHSGSARVSEATCHCVGKSEGVDARKILMDQGKRK